MSLSRGKSTRALPRAKKACQNCHARRVRCNVMETRPCHNCRVMGVLCELSKSKRETKQERKLALLALPANDGLQTLQENTWGDCSSEVRDLPRDFHRNQSTTVASTNAFDSAQELDHQISNLDDYSAIALSSATTSPQTERGSLVTDETIYIGESNLLTLVASADSQILTSTHTSNPSTCGLTYTISKSNNKISASAAHTSSCTNGAIDHLNREGAFTFPEKRVIEALLKAYFKWFHPCFPIVDAPKVSQEFKTNGISPMLLQAMLFIGTSYLNDDFFPSAGFGSRQHAKFHFYYRAKLIYDADWEINTMAILQTLFLISFWRSSASNEKDTRHWLAMAVSLAQKRGYHRSRAIAQDPGMLRLRKRIWWSLYIREQQCAASLGLPSRIRDEDCDVGKLCVEDFTINGVVEFPDIFGTSVLEHIHYCIHMAELAVLLGRVVLKKFAPRDEASSKNDKSQLKSELSTWNDKLPKTMQFQQAPESIWSSMLHLQHNHLLILLYGSVSMGAEDLHKDEDHSIALQAAYQTTRIVEDMLAKDLIKHGQVHLITCMFSTLCVHVLQMRQSTRSTVRQLAEYRARICLMGLKELRFSWDSDNWILQLFYQFLDSETAETLGIANLKSEPFTATQAANLNNTIPVRFTQALSRDSALSAPSITTDSSDRNERSTTRTSQMPVLDSFLDASADANSDFMSQLLNLRDADDAFFDGTMNFDFSSAEMNLDAIFDEASNSSAPSQRRG